MWHVARGTVVGPRCRVYIYHIVLLPLVVYTPHGCAIARALKQIFAQVKIFLEGTLVRNWILLVLHRAHFLTIVAPVRKKGGPNPSCSVRAMRAKTSVAELARCGYVRERSSPRNNGKRRRIIDCSLGTHEDNGHGGEAWRTAGFSIARVISDFPLRSGLSCSCRTFPLQDSFINNDRREFPREMLIFVAACFLCLFLLLRAFCVYFCCCVHAMHFGVASRRQTAASAPAQRSCSPGDHLRSCTCVAKKKRQQALSSKSSSGADPASNVRGWSDFSNFW